MSRNGEKFIRSLTDDPSEKALLTVVYRTQKNKGKVSSLADDLKKHGSEAIDQTTLFLQRPNIIIKSFQLIVVRKLRHLAPDAYVQWIQDMSDNYDEVLRLRARFNRMQTYSAVSNYISGLGQYGVPLNTEQKSCLLAANYVIDATGDDLLVSEAFEYNWHKYYIRLKDSELVKYIVSNPQDATRIKEVIVEFGLHRPAEIEAALKGATITMINGSL